MYSAVLHLTDLNDTHFHRCEQAVQIATCFNAPLYLLHVIETPPSLQIAQGLGFAEIDRPYLDDAMTVMQTLGEALQIPSEHLLVKVGTIREQALAALAELNCDLLIIGQHAHHFMLTLFESSAHSVADQVPCDVLTLR
jgi:universal stress protein A